MLLNTPLSTLTQLPQAKKESSSEEDSDEESDEEEEEEVKTKPAAKVSREFFVQNLHKVLVIILLAS